VEWAGGNLLVAIALIAVASLVLGMGLPVTAAYIVLATLSAPALTGLIGDRFLVDGAAAGSALLAAHLIIFWLSQDSNVTPPVCLTAFTAAAIAGTKSMATGLTAWKIAKGLYIVPLLFAYTPLVSGEWSQAVLVFVFALMGLYAFTGALQGHLEVRLSWPGRVVAAAAAVALLWPAPHWAMWTVHLAGAAGLVGLLWWGGRRVSDG
ncbi:MAG: TRAP transporter large permease subunit, partial [Alphaproteobacteria bacterium]|nr:TRAP transporter large permease subunit [Alphaproteobacteria bacterium]